VRDERDRVSRVEAAADSTTAAASWQGVGVLDLMQEGLQIIGFDWRYLYVNRAAAQHGRHSKQELLGNSMLELYPGIEHTPLFAAMQRCLYERTRECFDNEFTFPDGRQGWFELRIEPVPEGILVLSIDITLRRALQANLAMTQKMDALGRMAGGVAQDFNNILTVIVHSSEFVARSLPADDANQADLREILNVADRGARMVRQLLAFSRKQPRDARPLHVHDALNDLLPIVRRMVAEPVTVELALVGNNPAIRIDQSQLTQVVLSLVSNARDAISGKGVVAIRVDSVPSDAVRGEPWTDDAVDREYVRIAVSDTGCGMDQAVLARMFEPFFTTKAAGKGTGLGLAAAHGIVKQNEGEIHVASTPHEGTTVELFFPVARVDHGELVQRAHAPLAQARGGSEVVLVVDDEATIRTLCARALSKLGYTVLQVESPGEALRLVQSHVGPLDLVLSDVAMPEMSGVHLCQQLTASRPALRTLLMSGYLDSENHPDVDAAQILAKPFTQSDLARRVREVLDADR
jgi:two-component system, cell cycle sensor histidine kinase and response regulator CckA